jgi:hypothetical protein
MVPEGLLWEGETAPATSWHWAARKLVILYQASWQCRFCCDVYRLLCWGQRNMVLVINVNFPQLCTQ